MPKSFDNLPEWAKEWVKSPEFKEAMRRSWEDHKAGRVKPWEDIKNAARPMFPD